MFVSALRCNFDIKAALNLNFWILRGEISSEYSGCWHCSCVSNLAPP